MNEGPSLTTAETTILCFSLLLGAERWPPSLVPVLSQVMNSEALGTE